MMVTLIFMNLGVSFEPARGMHIEMKKRDSPNPKVPASRPPSPGTCWRAGGQAVGRGPRMVGPGKS